MRLMGGERAVCSRRIRRMRSAIPGGSHPQSWGNRGAANRDKDWSGQYVEAKSADVKNSEESGVELYRGFVNMAIKHAITRNAAWYCWHASKRQSMVERVWNEFGAFVHQQIIWVKSRPVLTYSTYLWQHEPCLFGWIKGEKPKTLRAQVGQTAGEFPTTVWEVPSSEVETRRASHLQALQALCAADGDAYRARRNLLRTVLPAAARNWSRRSRWDADVTRLKSRRRLSR